MKSDLEFNAARAELGLALGCFPPLFVFLLEQHPPFPDRTRLKIEQPSPPKFDSDLFSADLFHLGHSTNLQFFSFPFCPWTGSHGGVKLR